MPHSVQGVQNGVCSGLHLKPVPSWVCSSNVTLALRLPAPLRHLADKPYSVFRGVPVVALRGHP
ncbi:hypothetical protein [Acetobacter persici]|uniref:hypothetical protein n=1 Tax=Acetobacter persici TaxID=1076596 RepID=UPI001BAD6415|nr:hypothetical protein [Acetobacter persici]MBS0964084.1 hypothetical protein [Acetobacter persici]